MKTALTTAELLEPVPRSVMLAALTNNLPPGVSLLELDLIQKQVKPDGRAPTTSKYQAAQARNKASQTLSGQMQGENPEKLLETEVSIAGTAPSDLQVAAYIERLSDSSLLDNGALVESIECKIDDNTFRQFKLTATLRKDVHLTKDNIEGIKDRASDQVWNF